MKRVELLLVVLGLLLVSVLAKGFGGSAVSSSDELLKPQDSKTELARQWVEAYGVGPESVVHYNIAINRVMGQNVGRVVSGIGKYISDPSDPNSLAAKVEDNERRLAGLELLPLESRLASLELLTSKSVESLIGYQEVVSQQIGETLRLLTELVKRVEALEDTSIAWRDKDGILHLGNRGATAKSAEVKPYIYEDPIQRDPNTIVFFGTLSSTICTKHGRLGYGDTYTFLGSGRYCGSCASEVLTKYLDKHIGVDPNS